MDGRARVAALVAFASLIAAAAGAGGAGTASAAPSRPRYTERDLWLEAPSVHDGPICFPDEVLPIADAVAGLLARPELGYRVIPPKDLRALWREALAGRAPGRAARCEVAPPPSRLARLVYRGASMADLEVDCPDGSKGWGDRRSCVLDVRVLSERPTADDPDHLEETAHFHADLPAGETPARWAERLRAAPLLPGAPKQLAGQPGMLGLLGDGKRHKEPPFWIDVSFVSLSGDWKGAITGATFKKEGAALDACTRNQPRWRDNWAQPYLLEVDAAGTVKRCEFPYVDHLPPPEFACVCDVLRKRGFDAGAPGRRASFLLEVKHPAPSPNTIAALVGTRATDPSATLGDSALDEEALATCLEPVKTAISEPELPVKLTVGADGGVVSHAVTWPRAIPPRARRCLDDVLARSRFDCPLTGASTIDAKLQVMVAR
jgi:hypothetical protein